ncbi:uncharacterized protein BCR38DRAFT_435291 [Pseudomassariella vexata]|uniref:2EXR domain-containing protein n=1 Tax=Pseudomassariella vexata TaxID=1141098 RepID=A0A1Y2E0V5_9PEZI|nr:uncharacterized protein BCR38DRAFT_435291 [Pseudomassariella vexata]ORY64495.1 hypothetical protein BCR38DRAFT_435291 [Pseudomassariella vexata]
MSATSSLAVFPKFTLLPPELRHQIYLEAIPSPGINFFNVHTWLKDHEGCNKETTPPHLYLDLRRMAIEDDDEAVSRYDPSTWQVRYALRQTCREARRMCAIPSDKVKTLKMTRPKRGLYLKAGDDRLRSETPLVEEDALPDREPRVSREIQFHADEIVSLSIQNCSLNLPFEHSPVIRRERKADFPALTESDMGEAYVPLFNDPSSCLGIAEDKFCLSLTRDDHGPALSWAISEILPSFLESVCGVAGVGPGRISEEEEWLLTDKAWVMLDAETAVTSRADAAAWTAANPGIKWDEDEEFEPADTGYFWQERVGEVKCWDRWGDCYAAAQSYSQGFFVDQQLLKVRPEKTDIRKRYTRSGLLPSDFLAGQRSVPYAWRHAEVGFSSL